jgi:hypothetical protein
MFMILLSTGINTLQAQISSPTNEITKRQTVKRARVDPAGFVSLPDGYKIFHTKGRNIDAWFGYIESADGKFRIDYGAGMVGSLFSKYKKKVKWSKVEQTSKSPIKFGLVRIKKKDVLVARTGWIEFSAPIKQKSDEDAFMEIVRSYSREL